jgi:hypothetical protein
MRINRSGSTASQPSTTVAVMKSASDVFKTRFVAVPSNSTSNAGAMMVTK